MSAGGEKHHVLSKEEEDESLQAKQLNETSDNENLTDEGCTRERRHLSDKIIVANGSSLIKDNSCRAATEQPLGGAYSKQRSRSQVRAFPVADNTEIGNESESYETSTTFPNSASSISSSSSSDQIRLQTEGLQTNRLSLLSNLAQARAHAHAHAQRKAPPPLDESLLNQLSCVGASAAQLTAMVGLPPVLVPQLNPLLSPQSYLRGQLQLALIAQNRTGFPLDSHMPMAAPQVPLQVSSQPPSLLGQLQPASIAQLKSCARVLRQQIPAHQAPSPPSQTSQLLEMQLASLAQNLTGFPLFPQVPMTAGSPQQPPFQSSYSPPAQSAMALSREYFLLQQLSASRNPPLVLIAPQAQYQSRALKLQESNMIKGQIAALLLSQEQAGGKNTTTPGIIPSSANQTDLFLRALAASANPELNIRHSIQGTPAMAATAAVSAFHHSLPNPTFGNNYGMGFYSSGAASSDVAPRGHFHVQSCTKEKRWVIRYEELKQFQQVGNICNHATFFHLSRLSGLLPIPNNSCVSSLDKSEETWALSGASWLCRKSQAFLVGDEPAGPVSNA